MKNSTIQVRKYLLLFSVLLFSSYSFSQTTLYSENFQSSFGGWTVSSSGSGTGEWLRGTNVSHNTGNTGNYIHSRKDTSQYNNNTFITATSPAINLSGYTNLNLEIDIWYETEAAYDGMKIEYSLNNGSTWSDLGSVTNTNWYNDTDVDAFNNGEDGWSGNSTGWITRNLNLSTENINFETSTQVRFRILFASDGSITNTGVAFDEILIEGNIAVPQPEIDITGLTISIPDGDTTPSTADDTEFGSVGSGSTVDHTFTIRNTGTATLNLTGGSPLVDISGSAAFTILTQPGGSTIAAGASRTFVVRFAPSAAGTVTANISIDNNDSNENPYNFRVQGTGVAPLTEGPGGVTNDLALWLKGTDGLGYTTGQPVSLWADQGRGANATAPTGLEPTYRDAPLFNVNFNPVVDFDNDYDTAGEDFGYSDTNRNTLVGTEGFYTQDMFLVVIPDVNVTSSLASMDVFCGDIDPVTDERDGSGIGYGRYSVRFDNEIISYCVNTTSTSTVPVADRGYGIAHTGLTDNYNNVGIINSKNNSNSPTSSVLLYNANDIGNTEVGVPQFENVSNSRYFLGRSEAFKGSYEGRIAEVITYSAKKDDANLTQERNRIQSYLAIKYGITLGVNGTSQDYVDSDGTLIWDANTGTPAEDVFNYDIAGIGRDDASDLLQKQSRSVNNAVDGGFRAQGVLTIGMGAISNTNNLNTNSELEDKEFLVWGNNGIDLDTASPDITVNMSSSISPALTTDVSFSAISRTWKVVENVGSGGDIPSVEVAILRSAVRTATPPNGRYLMFISDTPNFDPTADYRVMTEGTNELGEAILKTNYDFDDTKYITFGWAPERTFERSVYFNGTSNYMDMEDALDVNPTAFTISSWIRRDVNSLNKSIVSKRDAAFTEGYDLKINAVGQFEASWKTASGAIQTTTSNTIIPENEWHQVAVIYQGGTAYIYIDGILDKQAAKSAPNNTDQSFYIGAASKLTPQAFFNGNIDEVRVWNTALTVKQLRYIMNQEIANNSGFVGGAYFLSKGVTPTKDEVAAIPWSSLAGYYPMSTYTYTNTKDESGNGHQGALRSLRTVDRQTAPLPYKTIGTGTSDWSLHTTWLNGNLQTIPGANSIVDNTITVDWNIVEVDDNVTMSNSSLTAGNLGNRNLLALFVESSELTLDGDNTTETGNGITVTHYLNLLGKIDLEGESQLIQTIDSDLNVGISGSLEKDQQGTLDVFTYNYWSAPVGNTATANPNNFSYSLNNNIMKDGTSSGAPANITYVGGYNGSNSDADLKIAHYWIWKYNNRIADNYASWQHVRNTGTLLAGEGFTMKGVTNTAGVVSLEQNYVFDGKPNNGNVGLTINAGNEYLVGNPYASAIDAEQFITDNGPTISGSGANPAISGTLYFWEHWGGGSHVTAEYQGGYGTYNFSGGTPAASMGTNHPDGGTGGTATKTPGRYIPVGQGFFVAGESNGSVVFNNGQRRFQKEGGTGSVFMRSTEDNIDVVDSRMKIRLGFNSVNTIHRQLLVTADDRASIDYDWGFDGLLNEVQIDEMAWVIHADKYTIQGINSFTEDTVLPLNIVTRDDGLNNITIDNLENIPSDLEIYVHDIALDIYHNLRTDGDYEFYLDAGEYADRFEITFRDGNSLGTEDVTAQENLQVYFANAQGSIIIHNPKMVRLDAAEMFNIIGQSIIRVDTLEDSNYQEIKVNGLSTGTYIINLEKTDGSILSKKVIVK